MAGFGKSYYIGESPNHYQHDLQGISKTVAGRLEALTDRMVGSYKANREELARNLKEFAGTLEKSINSFKRLQCEKFGQLEVRQNELVKSTEARLESIR